MSAKPWVSSGPIEKQLRILRRRGLIGRRVDDLGALLDAARRLSTKATDKEKIEDVVMRAVGNYEQPSRDCLCLWFGLPTENPTLPNTRGMKPGARTRLACDYWLREVEPKIAASTFETHRVEEFYQVLAKYIANGELSREPRRSEDHNRLNR